MVKTCLQCGKLIIPSVDKRGYLEGNFKKRKFCSLYCSGKGQGKRTIPDKKRCIQCNKIFIQPLCRGYLRSSSLFKKRKFCSKTCSGISRRKDYNKTCYYCNKSILRLRGKSGKLKSITKFCSNTCMGLGRVLKIDVGNSQNSVRAKRMMAYIKECNKCGSKEKLHVHHKDRNRKNNEKKNLTKLCHKCHYELHKRAGDGGGRKKKVA